MKQYLSRNKKFFALLLSLALVITLIPATDSRAASIKLNKKNASVFVSKSITLKVSGTKKQVKWSSANPEIASVSKGKVTGKKPGKTIISAKVSGKTMKCTVIVKYNQAVGNKNITSVKTDLYNGILIKYTNKNNYPVSIITKLRYRDSAKTTVSEKEDHNYCLEAGKSTYFYFPKPTDRNFQYIKYTDYTISMKADVSPYKGYTADITQWCNAGAVTANMTAYNYSGKDLTAAKISVLYYDKKGNITAYMPYYPGCLQKDSKTEDVLSYPSYLSNPAKAETFVDYAY